jgi:hypothetical protein
MRGSGGFLLKWDILRAQIFFMHGKTYLSDIDSFF